jgi:hypothetical protein
MVRVIFGLTTAIISLVLGSTAYSIPFGYIKLGDSCSTTVVHSSSGIDGSLDACGAYQISVPSFAWTFGGNLGQTPTNIIVNTGSDSVGAYSEIDFDYSQGGQRTGGIRVFENELAVLFKVDYVQAASNGAPFPTLATYPQKLQHLAYQGTFGLFTFTSLASDSPWLFFDSAGNTFVLSPASDFLVASTVRGTDGSISSGISSQISSLPAGFSHQTLLVLGKGINFTYQTWGQAMTALRGKVRPANDADTSLKYLGYWTDNGAGYYYHFDSSKGSYEQTLLGVRDNFTQLGLKLGYVQLDSWFYPKGVAADWQDKSGGIYEYVAASALFPNGLQAFQQQLGVPLITHARWIDPSSSYHQTYTMSGKVVIDPLYWNSISSYLHDAGAVIYEQDWLATQAHANFNLTDPKAFMDNMASGMSAQALNIQYCMPLPHHYLQSSQYSNVTTIRTSQDLFQRSNWDQFLYGSQLAGVLGVWPWSDVFMSSQTNNLLLSTLSAGPVGVGDFIGSLNGNNLLLAVRPDSIIVKPDVPLVPLDQTIINDSAGLVHPMVAATSTNFGIITAHYVAGYNRTSDLNLAFSPSVLGITQPAYIYNYFTKVGRVVQPQDTFSDVIANGIGYYIVMPVGPSGMAFLGDTGQYVSLGKKRITALTDNGTITASIAFASAESARNVFGYSPTAPVITATNGKAGTVNYTSSTGLFNASVVPGSGASATIEIKAGDAVASVSPTSLSFPDQSTGTTSTPQSATLSNKGNAVLNIASISAAGDFAETNNCGASVAADASCTIQLTFMPTSTGPRSGSVVITDNAPDSPQTIALTGNVLSSFTISTGAAPVSATVIAGATATFNLSLTAYGGFSGAVQFSCSGAPPASNCTVSPNPLNLTGTNPAAIAVSIATAGRTGAQVFPDSTQRTASRRTSGLALLAVCSVFGIMLVPMRRHTGGKRRSGVLVGLILLTLLCFGCGGGSSTSVGNQKTGTPSGTYAITVSGSSGNISQSAMLKLTVQ